MHFLNKSHHSAIEPLATEDVFGGWQSFTQDCVVTRRAELPVLLPVLPWHLSVLALANVKPWSISLQCQLTTKPAKTNSKLQPGHRHLTDNPRKERGNGGKGHSPFWQQPTGGLA